MSDAEGPQAALKAETRRRGINRRKIKAGQPIRYIAEPFGPHTDSDRAIRWLIALMALYGDPLVRESEHGNPA